MLNAADNKVTERPAIELVAGSFALDLPEVAINIEDAVAKEILKDRDEAGALGVVVEVGFKYVLHDSRVGRDNTTVARAAVGNGVGRSGSKYTSDPVMEVVAVL